MGLIVVWMKLMVSDVYNLVAVLLIALVVDGLACVSLTLLVISDIKAQTSSRALGVLCSFASHSLAYDPQGKC